MKTEKQFIKAFKEVAAQFNMITDELGIDVIKIPSKSKMVDIDIIFDNMIDSIPKANFGNIPAELNQAYSAICAEYKEFLDAEQPEEGEDKGEEQPPTGEPPANLQNSNIDTSDKAQPQSAITGGPGTQTPPPEKKERKPRTTKPKSTAPVSANEDLEKAIIELAKGMTEETIDGLSSATLKTIMKVQNK